MSDGTKDLTTATVDRGDKHQLTRLFNLTPRNLVEATEYAKLMAATNLVPKDFIGKPQTVLIAVQMGMELGLSALQAVNSIAVINGRATMWGDAVLAIVVQANVLDTNFGTGGYLEREPSECLKLKEGRFEVKRKGWKETLVRTFTMADAERAGLPQRSGPTGPWSTYPGRMLMARARSWGLRDSCPDVLKGLKFREEEEDYARTLKDGMTGAPVAEDGPRRKVINAETVQPGDADKILKETVKLEGGGQQSPTVQPAKFPPPQEQTGPQYATWRGQISGVSSIKTAKNPKYKLATADGQTFETFSKTLADLAFECKGTGEEVVIEWKQTQYGKDITTLIRASDEEAPPGDEEAGE